MFKIQTIQAAFGDCFLLKLGSEARARYVLIDGGPPDNYSNHLRTALLEVKQAGQDLDLVVLSHVDNDHVRGLNDYLGELRQGSPALPTISSLWHNSFSNTIGTGNEFQTRFKSVMAHQQAASMAHAGIAINGIKEGHKLRLDALALGVPVNTGFPNDLITVDSAPNPISLGNAKITIVGPTATNLENLRAKWDEWLTANEDAIGNGDFQALANSDRSIPNLSSISFLVEADGHTALFTGDARSDHLLDGLSEAGLLSQDNALHVDVLKLPHHGSDRNITKSFFKKVTADNYLVSADGTYDNPDYETLKWIVQVAAEQSFVPKLVFTNRTDSVDQLLDDFPPGEGSYLYEILQPAHHWLTLNLA